MSTIRTMVAVTIAAMLGLGAACTHTVPLQTSPAVAAAEGKLKVKKGDNGNTMVKLNLEHLAEPEDVAPGTSTYVVWIEGPGTVQNVGALKVGDEKEASLETVTPLEDFNIFITAESSATAAAPTGQRYIFARVDQ